jgi:UDP-GlcNAc:undecaprenyl-phosphate/decaprenyl-phosphate GlcNAc-1-phosphate transferase
MTLVFLSALFTSLVGVRLLLPCLRAMGVVDVPNARSSHAEATPRGGGLAVVVAIALACAVGFRSGLPPNGWVLVGVLGFAVLGFADDLRGLDVSVRLAVQATVAFTVSAALMWGGPTRPPVWTVATVLIGLVWLIGYTNAFNFMDGVNGIAGLNAAMAGSWFLYVGLSHGLNGVAALGAAVGGGALGFLPWNTPTARVFLGDVGSYALGFAVGCLALWAWTAGVPVLVAGAPLVIYVADTGLTLTRRVVGGRSWRRAHREHVYQRLADLGLGHAGSALTCAAASAVMCGWAYASDQAGTSDVWVVLGDGLVVAAYLALPTLLAARQGTLPRTRELIGSHPGGEA